MKKILALLTIAAAITACTNDDRYTWDDDFADRTATDTINIGIRWNGTSVTVTGDDHGYVTTNGADVTVSSNTNKFLNLQLSGASNDGSLLIYSWKKLGIVLNGLQLTNNDGPAINNQCSKWLYVTLAEGTVNSLADGESYSEKTYDQKGTIFSEGQICFLGKGSLTVTSNAKSGIVSDDFIEINGGTLNIMAKADGGRGIKVNDGLTINGGTTTITTSGDCKIETVDGVRDTTSAAGIKSDSLFVMTGGTLVITSTGDGGKGINCSGNVEFKGGTLNITTIGSNDEGKPKGVKSDTAIIVSGGSFTVEVNKSWACDNGSESEEPEDRLTILGSPVTKKLQKKSVFVQY